MIYINDICNVSSAWDILLFPDDTSIFFSHKVLDSLCLTVNNELVKLTDWFSANKLSINIKKSNYIIFRPRQKRQTFDIKVTLSNRDIIQVKETVFLGVILDEHLTWIPHITNVARKVSKTVGVMYKASFCLSKRSLITLYYSLLYPYLQYFVSVWGSTYPSNLNRIFMLQKERYVLLLKNLLMPTLTRYLRILKY